MNFTKIILVLIILVFTLISCGNEKDSDKYTTETSTSEYDKLRDIVKQATINLNIEDNNLLYHYQNIFNYAYFLLRKKPEYLVELDNLLDNKIDYSYLQNKIETDDKSRLSILQFSYLLAKIESYKKQNNLNLNNERLNYLNNLIKQLWLNIRAWHWKTTFPNIKERTLAKIQRNEAISGKNYYYAVIDEDIFLVGIASELISSKTCLEFSLCKEILETYYDFFRQKIILENGFSYSKGDWWDHPDYAYAGCESYDYPSNPCPKTDIEPDISHFHRMTWIFDSLNKAFSIIDEKEKAVFFSKVLKSFYLEYNNFLLESKNGFPLLKNFINGTNGWYRVGYNKEYKNFGYGPYDLSLVQVLGSYYYKNPNKSYVTLMKQILKDDNFI